MKSDNLLIIAMLGLAGYLVMKGTQAKTGNKSGGLLGSLGLTNLLNLGGSKTSSNSSEILDNGRPWSNGWRYFSDGTSIGPDGKYYYQGQEVYNPDNYWNTTQQVDTEIMPQADNGAIWI